MRTIKELESKGYKKLHTSYTRGYISRKSTTDCIRPYKGKFGEGYKVFTPCFNSSQYCYVTYWIK
jgi:hypothetical protein